MPFLLALKIRPLRNIFFLSLTLLKSPGIIWTRTKFNQKVQQTRDITDKYGYLVIICHKY